MVGENIDLRFLAEQGKQILAELAEARAEQRAMREEFGKRPLMAVLRG